MPDREIPQNHNPTQSPPRPPRSIVIAENLPTFMAGRHNWVLWRWEWVGGRWTKVPHRPNGRRASSTDSHTWSPLEDVLIALERDTQFDGIGFVLTKELGLVGFDFDHVIKRETGEVDPVAARYIAILNSYCEITPSGDGLRCFVFGTLPPEGRKCGPFECYDSGRFLTVTGNLLGMMKEIIHNQAGIDAVHQAIFGERLAKRQAPAMAAPAVAIPLADHELIDMLRRSQPVGPKFIDLYDGGDFGKHGYPSASEADLYVCGRLAWATGRDPERIERMFRASALWVNRKRAKPDSYVARTIQKAIEQTATVYQPPKRPGKPLGEALQKTRPSDQSAHTHSNGKQARSAQPPTGTAASPSRNHNGASANGSRVAPESRHGAGERKMDSNNGTVGGGSKVWSKPAFLAPAPDFEPEPDANGDFIDEHGNQGSQLYDVIDGKVRPVPGRFVKYVPNAKGDGFVHLYSQPDGSWAPYSLSVSGRLRVTSTVRALTIEEVERALEKLNPTTPRTEAKPSADEGSDQEEDQDHGRVARADRKAIKALHEQIHRDAAKLAKKEKIDFAAALDRVGNWSASRLEEVITINLKRSYARDRGERLYTYRGGTYRGYGEREIMRLVKAVIYPVRKWSAKFATETIARIRADAPYLWDSPPLTILNLKNCLLDIRNPAKPVPMKHTPDHLSPIQLPVKYDPKAKSHEWDSQIEATFTDDCAKAETAYELVAWLMLPNRSIQKALLLLGEGGTGKSTFLAALKAFLGKANVTANSLQRLENDRFATSRLVGKLANIFGDLPSSHLETVSVFKLMTGVDSMSAEYKYAEPFDFDNYARGVFSANRPPASSEADDAYFGRWWCMSFDHVYRDTKDDKPRAEIDAKLAAPEQLSGVLNRALEKLPAVLKNNTITVTQSMKDAHAKFWTATAPLAVWLAANTYQLSDVFVPISAIRAAYNADAAKAGRAQLDPSAFGKAFRRALPHLAKPVKRTVGNEQVWCYVGIALRGNYNVNEEEQAHGGE